MTPRQHILKFFYPVITVMSRLTKRNAQAMNNSTKKDPPVSFYSLHFTANDGKEVSFEQFRGKKVVLVNTASFCGYTPQYSDLEALWQCYRDRGLVVLGVPSNDFGRQEPGSTGQIKEFCTTNYSVDFPLTEKCRVIGGEASLTFEKSDGVHHDRN